MDHAALLALYDQEERIKAVPPFMCREETPAVVRHLSTRDDRGFISYSQMTEDSVEQVIDEQIARFAEADHSFEWKVYDHDRPDDLKERLQARGFEIDVPEAIMVLDLSQAPSSLLAPVAGDVRRLESPDRLPDVVSVLDEVWQTDHSWLIGWLGDTMRAYPELYSIYVVYADGRPVSVAWLYVNQDSMFGSLWGGSTLEAYRKRGYYTALLAVRVQEALRRGLRFLTVDASPMSRPIVERLGFRWITTAHACRYPRNAAR